VGAMAWGGLGTKHGSWRCPQVEPTSVANLRFVTAIHQVRLGLQSHVALVIGQLFFLPEVPYAVSQKTKSYQ
jgi:hypothetical protein